MGRPTEPLLSRERIAVAALELMDRQDGHVTLTQVARALGVSGPSLYHHVRGREDLFEAVRDHIHTGLGPKLDPGWSWQDAVRHVARSDRASIGEHPWTVPSMMLAPVQAAEALESVRTFADILERAGFAPSDVLRVIGSVDLLAVGGALDVNSPEQVYGDEPVAADDALGRALRASRTGRARADEAFEFALDRLVDSLERHLERARS